MNGLLLMLLFIAIVVALVLFVGLKLRFIRVPEEERKVIYHVGRVDRVAGPGRIYILERWENIERTIYVRDQALNFRVSELFIYGVPFGYRLNLWCRYDIEAAASGSQAKLMEFAQCDDEERYQFANVKVQEALRASVSEYEINYPLGKKASVADKLTPIIPGTLGCHEILAGVTRRLAKSLPTVGIIFNTEHAINVVGLPISNQIAGDFQRGRTVSQLREQFPHLSEEFLAQMAAPIGDLEQPFTDNFRLDQNDEKSARVGVRKNSEGKKDTRVSMRRDDEFMEEDVRHESVRSKEEAIAEAEPAPSRSDKPARITRNDVAILKPVPRRAQ